MSDILGLDGAYVDKKMLRVDETNFRSCDLAQRLPVEGTFDLVLSLEVAEHLPAERAGSLGAELTRLGPVVLFSATIPFQGANGHLNEEWPGHWVRHFRDRGFASLGCLRRAVWEDNKVDWWYAQDLALYLRPEYLDELRGTAIHRFYGGRDSLPLVHPRQYASTADPAALPGHPVARTLPHIVKRGIVKAGARVWRHLRGGNHVLL